MVNENFYSKKMHQKSVSELQNYIKNRINYQEDAVIAAIWELENRNEIYPEMQVLKKELEALNNKVNVEPKMVEAKSVTLYSFNFIFLFGILFSVFAGSILIGLNLIQLKNKSRARLAIFSGLIYSFIQVYLIEYFKITSPFVSVFTSLLGIYMLNYYFLKPELKPDEIYLPQSTWQPLLIGIAIALPIAYFIMKSGGMAAL